MRISDFFKSFTENKNKEFDFEILEEHPRNSYPGCHLVIIMLDKEIFFFQFHDTYEEAFGSFKLLASGHWCNFGKGDIVAHVVLLDYYKIELLKEQTIIFKDISKRSKHDKQSLFNKTV